MTNEDRTAQITTLDATGLLCPLPVLKARRALTPLAAGAGLEVLATDPGAVRDFAHFCTATACELLYLSEYPGGVLRFRRRAGMKMVRGGRAFAAEVRPSRRPVINRRFGFPFA